jgi:hypothetical protein
MTQAKVVKIEQEIGEFTISATVRTNQPRDYKEFDKKTRVYGALDALVPELLENEPHTDKAIPFKVDREDFDTEEAFLAMKAAKSEYNSWRIRTTKAAKAKLLPLLAEFINSQPDIREAKYGNVLKAEFSRTAGCSCPCSPGFVLSSRILTTAFMPVDFWIDNTEELRASRERGVEQQAAKERAEELKKVEAARLVLENAGYTVAMEGSQV